MSGATFREALHREVVDSASYWSSGYVCVLGASHRQAVGNAQLLQFEGGFIRGDSHRQAVDANCEQRAFESKSVARIGSI
jgi:hypothetical protein